MRRAPVSHFGRSENLDLVGSNPGRVKPMTSGLSVPSLALGNTSVMRLMKVGNIVPRAEIEPTSLAFWASVLTITPHRVPDVTNVPMPTCLRSSLPERSVQITTQGYRKE